MSEEQFEQLIKLLSQILANQETLEEDIRILSEKVDEMDTSYGDGFQIDRLDT
jgi:hypothetical protein